MSLLCHLPLSKSTVGYVLLTRHARWSASLNMGTRDTAGRSIIQLAVDRATLDELLCFGAEAAESEDGGDDEPYAVPRAVSACWLEAA
jgi:hypothetical protein